MFELSRRNFLRAGAAAGGVAVVGGGWALFRTREQLLEDVLRRALPGVSFDPDGLELFKQDFFRLQFSDLKADIKLRATSILSGLIGVKRVMGIGAFRQKLADIEDLAVTQFLTYSDFFLFDDPHEDTITYWGIDPERPCPNPFARFGFD